MRPEDLQAPGDLADAEATIVTNSARSTTLERGAAAAAQETAAGDDPNVSSGLAFVPMAATPTYCATKAAIHSYSQSLRYQLRQTSVQVIELIPPYVQTELMGPGQASDPGAMPLKDFIAETMNILKASPDGAEICVERVKPLRFAEADGSYAAFFKNFNDAMSAGH